MTDEPLLECPNVACGSPMRVERSLELGDDLPMFWAQCDECNLRAPNAYSRLDAIELSNSLPRACAWVATKDELPPRNAEYYVDVACDSKRVLEKIFVYEVSPHLHTHWRRHTNPQHPDE